MNGEYTFLKPAEKEQEAAAVAARGQPQLAQPSSLKPAGKTEKSGPSFLAGRAIRTPLFFAAAAIAAAIAP